METSCSFDSSFCSGEGDDSLRPAGQVHAVQALVQVSNNVKHNTFSLLYLSSFFITCTFSPPPLCFPPFFPLILPPHSPTLTSSVMSTRG